MAESRFFKCNHCGNMIGMIFDSGVPVVCCGEEMAHIEANTVDASREKHVPYVTVDADEVRVQIGSQEHPMIEAHHIEWIYVQTEGGGQRKALAAGDDPVRVFALTGDKATAVYAYCNLHGLWVTYL